MKCGILRRGFSFDDPMMVLFQVTHVIGFPCSSTLPEVLPPRLSQPVLSVLQSMPRAGSRTRCSRHAPVIKRALQFELCTVSSAQGPTTYHFSDWSKQLAQDRRRYCLSTIASGQEVALLAPVIRSSFAVPVPQLPGWLPSSV
jgi:hypothetical protein